MNQFISVIFFSAISFSVYSAFEDESGAVKAVSMVTKNHNSNQINTNGSN